MLNNVLLIGNVGKDPEVRTLNSGEKVANFTLATSENYTDKSGEKQTITEWHNIVVFGNLCDVIEKYVEKGMRLYLEGKIRTRSYEDKDGNKKYTTEILLDKFNGKLLMLSNKQDNGNQVIEGAKPSTKPNLDEIPDADENTDNLPF